MLLKSYFLVYVLLEPFLLPKDFSGFPSNRRYLISSHMLFVCRQLLAFQCTFSLSDETLFLFLFRSILLYLCNRKSFSTLNEQRLVLPHVLLHLPCDHNNAAAKMLSVLYALLLSNHSPPLIGSFIFRFCLTFCKARQFFLYILTLP